MSPLSPPPAGELPPEVRAAVLAWARETDPDEAPRRLARARADLDPALHARLRAEVAEVVAEGYVELLAREDGVVPGETVEIDGIVLYRKQVERLSAFVAMQEALAEALGLSLEAWVRALQAGMERWHAAARREAGLGPPSVPPADGRPVHAERQHGPARRRPNAVPPRGPSSLSSLLSARTAALGGKKKRD